MNNPKFDLSLIGFAKCEWFKCGGKISMGYVMYFGKWVCAYKIKMIKALCISLFCKDKPMNRIACVELIDKSKYALNVVFGDY